jgi:multidrug resistance efflux pump
VAIPLTTAAVPWNLRRVPLATRSTGWRRLLAGVLVAGLAGVAVLWIAFTIDYETTRQVYFTAAIAHVLAEVPFLLRLL